TRNGNELLVQQFDIQPPLAGIRVDPQVLLIAQKNLAQLHNPFALSRPQRNETVQAQFGQADRRHDPAAIEDVAQLVLVVVMPRAPAGIVEPDLLIANDHVRNGRPALVPGAGRSDGQEGLAVSDSYELLSIMTVGELRIQGLL